MSVIPESLNVWSSITFPFDQKKDLVTQEQKLLSYAQQLHKSKPENIISISDLGSGLNYKKKGLKQLLNLILLGKVQTLIINHKDRLLRFGSELIFTLCAFKRVTVKILEDSKERSFEEELSSDVIELMTELLVVNHTDLKDGASV